MSTVFNTVPNYHIHCSNPVGQRRSKMCWRSRTSVSWRSERNAFISKCHHNEVEIIKCRHESRGSSRSKHDCKCNPRWHEIFLGKTTPGGGSWNENFWASCWAQSRGTASRWTPDISGTQNYGERAILDVSIVEGYGCKMVQAAVMELDHLPLKSKIPIKLEGLNWCTLEILVLTMICVVFIGFLRKMGLKEYLAGDRAKNCCNIPRFSVFVPQTTTTSLPWRDRPVHRGVKNLNQWCNTRWGWYLD